MPALAEGGPTEVYKCCCYYLLSLMIVVAVVLFPLGCLKLSNTTTLCTVLQKTPSEWQWIESDPRNDIDIECIDHITRSDKYLYPGASTTQLNSTQLNQQRTHQGRYRYIHSLNLPISSPLSSFSNFFTRHSSNKNPAATMYATPAKTCVYK